jgi:hypothetical protein
MYDSSGELTMNWSFANRTGDLTISNFDARSYSTGANGLTQPSLEFSGSLKQTGGESIGLTSGSVTGSFVNNGPVAAGGVMGKWGVEEIAIRRQVSSAEPARRARYATKRP